MIAYSEPIRKIASARLPFCSFMALNKQKKRHITRSDVTKNKRCRLEKFT